MSIKFWICLVASVLALECACIGRQPPQQGTWSKQDGYKTKASN